MTSEKRAKDILKRCMDLFEKALPKFNWGASALDAEAIQLLNEVPAAVGLFLGEQPTNTRGWIVGKFNTFVSMPVAVFGDKDDASAWAKNANEWYGEDHPLTPLEVYGSDVLVEPRPFPVEALRGKV